LARRLWSSGLCLALLTGCNITSNLHVMQPVTPPTEEITLSLRSSTPTISEERLSQLRTQLTTKLASEKIAVLPTPGPNTARLEGTVDHYDRGSRAKRAWLGSGFGTFDSSWHVVDGAGREIGHCRIDGRLTGGWFGGSYEDLLDEIGERVAQCLRNQPRS